MNNKHFNQFKTAFNKSAVPGGARSIIPIFLGLGFVWLAK
jgi:hypothetical protein